MILRPSHYWRQHVKNKARPLFAEAMLAEPCNGETTIAMLSLAPQPELSWFDRVVAVLTTPFKRVGISGWKETGCLAKGEGTPVRPAQHSTDGFWTIDLRLLGLVVGGATAAPDRYLRLEVEPGTAAHGTCQENPPSPTTRVGFGGAVVVDTDGPFLEVHPVEDFEIE